LSIDVHTNRTKSERLEDKEKVAGVNEATRRRTFSELSPQFITFITEHNGRFHETPIIRLHTAKGDGETSSSGHCTWCSALLHIAFLTQLQDGNENPFTRLSHSDRYHKLLKARKQLPVFAQMDDFYKMVSSALPLCS
jgi:hypothetical protein